MKDIETADELIEFCQHRYKAKPPIYLTFQVVGPAVPDLSVPPEALQIGSVLRVTATMWEHHYARAIPLWHLQDAKFPMLDEEVTRVVEGVGRYMAVQRLTVNHAPQLRVVR